MATTKSVDEDIITIDIKPFIAPAANIFSAMIIAGAILISGGINSGGGAVAGTTNTNDNNAQVDTNNNNNPGTENNGPVLATSSIDDDAVLGDKNKAKIAILEFSDYECPYCQRFYNDTLEQLKTEYVDTGKAILVFRDLPLYFHAPGAEREANAAECVRAQLGDSAYYSMHDYIFENTPTNGPGVSVADLTSFGKGLGANSSKLKDCIDNQDFAEEIAADAAAASSIGINGTPGFLIGTLNSDGSVDGEILSGAQPFSAFSSVIEKYL